MHVVETNLHVVSLQAIFILKATYFFIFQKMAVFGSQLSGENHIFFLQAPPDTFFFQNPAFFEYATNIDFELTSLTKLKKAWTRQDRSDQDTSRIIGERGGGVIARTSWENSFLERMKQAKKRVFLVFSRMGRGGSRSNFYLRKRTFLHSELCCFLMEIAIFVFQFPQFHEICWENCDTKSRNVIF